MCHVGDKSWPLRFIQSVLLHPSAHPHPPRCGGCLPFWCLFWAKLKAIWSHAHRPPTVTQTLVGEAARFASSTPQTTRAWQKSSMRGRHVHKYWRVSPLTIITHLKCTHSWEANSSHTTTYSEHITGHSGGAAASWTCQLLSIISCKAKKLHSLGSPSSEKQKYDHREH